ncbi:MAG: GspH/FimT family pseudopilin [Burkholderiaceae bacterium]
MKRSPIPRQILQSSSFGFSLIELLSVIAITAIFAAVAGPSFRDFIAGQRIKAASYDLSYTLTYARSEAIKRNSQVVLAPGAGGWQDGWTVTTGTITLSQHEPFVDLSMTGPTTNLVYNGSGRLLVAVAPFVLSSASSNVQTRCVSITLSGLPTSKIGAC